MNFRINALRLSATSLLCGLAAMQIQGEDAKKASPFGGLGALTASASKATVADLAAQFGKAAVLQPDKLLGAVGGDLVGKLKLLDETLGVGNALKSQLTGSLQALLGGHDSAALSSVFLLSKAANLTPEQLTIAKDVSNLATAYVVQRNFASLDGASSDVATIVNSLRKGELAPAIPAIQNVSKNVNLTPPQKQLITSVAGKYAPGLKKAKDGVEQGLQGLKGLQGLGK